MLFVAADSLKHLAYLKHLAGRCHRIATDTTDAYVVKELEAISFELFEKAEQLEDACKTPAEP